MTKACPYFSFGSIAAGLLLAFVTINGHAAPPLQPHEEVVKTKDGCGLVMDKTTDYAKYQREALSKVTWGGACVEGLAMGQGLLSNGYEIAGQPKNLPLRGWAWHGRAFGGSESRWENGRTGVLFFWDGKSASYANIDKPTWSTNFSESSNVSIGVVSVRTMLLNGKASISFYDKSKAPPFTSYDCPGGSSSGCEALWVQHATPVIEQAKSFIAENEPKAKARRAEVEVLVAKWQKQIGSAEVARREAAAVQSAAVESQRAKWEQDCTMKESQVTMKALDFNRPQSANDAAKANALKNLYEGECKGHPNSAKALAEASKLMRDSDANRAKEQAQAKEIEQARAQQREADARDRKEALSLLGKAAEGYTAAAVAGGGSKERRDAALNAMSGNASAPASAGVPAGGVMAGGMVHGCPVEDVQPFVDTDSYGGYHPSEKPISYKPLDCVSIEWRTKPKYIQSNETGRQARITNRCPCKIHYRVVGSLGGSTDIHAILSASTTTSWISEHKGAEKFELVPQASCHYNDDLIAKHHLKAKRCVARKCKDKDSYGFCGYGPANK